MLGENLDKLKQFEYVLKQCLIKRFGASLPENKVSQLNNTEYIIGNEFTNDTDRNTFQGNVLRHMLDSIIDVTCLKEISVDGINTSTLVYGRGLEDGIIEYYTQELSKLFKFNVNEIPELNEYVELVRKLKEVYGDALDSKVFSENATKLLNVQTLKEVADKCDEDAVKRFLEKNKQVEESQTNTDVDNKIFNDITARSGSVQIIYLDEKKYIKYIDNYGKLHLVQAYNSERVSDFYREKISNLKPDEQLDPEAFFKELCEIATEENLTPTEDTNIETLNFDQQRMINFVDTSEKLGQETVENVQEKNTILHNEDGTIHAISGTNEVIHTEDKLDHVEADVITDGQNYANENASQSNASIGDRPLTEEEYNDLCMRYANNERLSADELRALMMSTPELMDGQQQQEPTGPVLHLNGSRRNAAFANKSILIYILMIVAFIGVFIGAMIFSITN